MISKILKWAQESPVSRFTQLFVGILFALYGLFNIVQDVYTIYEKSKKDVIVDVERVILPKTGDWRVVAMIRNRTDDTQNVIDSNLVCEYEGKILNFFFMNNLPGSIIKQDELVLFPLTLQARESVRVSLYTAPLRDPPRCDKIWIEWQDVDGSKHNGPPRSLSKMQTSGQWLHSVYE